MIREVQFCTMRMPHPTRAATNVPCPEPAVPGRMLCRFHLPTAHTTTSKGARR